MNAASDSEFLAALTALSALDGRYASKVGALRPILSEYGYMHRRLLVELHWFEALSDAGFAEFAALDADSRTLLKHLGEHFDVAHAAQIKQIEKTTNHDVKALEYWIKRQFASSPALASKAEFVHFACTSEDINNCAHALQLKDARDAVLVPSLSQLVSVLETMAKTHANTPMLSRTHGQTASPTTLGKEMRNVAARLARATERVAAVRVLGKLNGAVGNYSAHTSAWPEFDWPALAKSVVQDRLGLHFQPLSTQIEPHDYMAELFDAIAHCNVVLIDLCRDMWGYISLGYFKQRTKAGEVGSSTMPHKVNPIDFENAEGNLGMANAMLRHFSDKLPISRWQRDLSDSTVLRCIGSALGHCLLAYQGVLTGLGKSEVNTQAIDADLDNAWEVLAEPIQTVMRRFGLPEPYEQLKSFTRGQAMTADHMRQFVQALELPMAEKSRLLNLTPRTYIGLAAQLSAA